MKTFFLLFISVLLTTSIFSQAGTLDPTFGDGGVVYYYEEDVGLDVYGIAWFNSVAEQQDGKIITTGLQSDDDVFWFDVYSDITMRFNADGSLDSSLSPAGMMESCNSLFEKGLSIIQHP
ncbi:MAG: delta-60 repeat domain-containing protein, partial [Fimbriimonadaceae bacterium]|nr:delta-60 repeat domain-containing protein [Chitinophagales bacterium]